MVVGRCPSALSVRPGAAWSTTVRHTRRRRGLTNRLNNWRHDRGYERTGQNSEGGNGRTARRTDGRTNGRTERVQGAPPTDGPTKRSASVLILIVDADSIHTPITCRPQSRAICARIRSSAARRQHWTESISWSGAWKSRVTGWQVDFKHSRDTKMSIISRPTTTTTASACVPGV